MAGLENDGKNWTWEETLIAFDLYSRIPFSKISRNNEEIIKTAEILKRKPGAVAKKLFNIASHDPKQIDRGVSGLSHSSKLDKRIWEAFEENSFKVSVDAKEALSHACNVEVAEIIDNESDSVIVEMFPYGEDRMVAAKARVGQYFFRAAVLSAYHRRCCVTGIGEPKLLIASHIKPWKVSSVEKERANPRNGLCLNALHDRAFDQGFITINNNYEIVISDKITEAGMDSDTKDWFMHYSGTRIELPDKFLPGKEFIEYHNDVVFMR